MVRLNAIVLLCLTLSLGTLHAGGEADPGAIVRDGNARFTMLTPSLIRMEWSKTRTFEERPSLVFINRKLPVPKFTSSVEAGWRVISTDNLTLKYREGSGPFDSTNLFVTLRLDGRSVRWHPGMPDSANLGGTIRTLDGVRGATPLDPGLLSRAGWTLVDDSERPLFDSSNWPWVVARPAGEEQDWYFFGYGHDFRKALFDFTQVSGKIPMPPRFAFGLWWSKYWAYTDEDFKELVREFRIHSVPLDVLVIDMDWHQTFNLKWHDQPKDQAGQPLGWTGYTWDSTYFPEPEKFLSWCDDQGLRTPLNLHPASGIQPHELHYPEMARAMGIDPASRKYVPFDIVDKKFAQNYMNLIIRPLERQGVDFWWLDWQQWSTTKIPGVTPTWWLNYVFFTDMERQGKARPLLFHRWGGLGNHRYEIGFSGDVISVWESLAFQPYFTATAANVGYGYWSHDIGGHMPGNISPELYTRWVQFGAFSPILRTHTTKNIDAERRIWAYPPDNFLIMRDAIDLRYAMIPYIYTSARNAYDTGISICHPLYYDWPGLSESYRYSGEYLFGNDLLVAPVTKPVSTESLLATDTLWIPPGEWIEWKSAARFTGPMTLVRTYALDELPVFVRAGSILPMAPPMKNSHERPVDPLILTVFPDAKGSGELYEDAGNDLGYQKGAFRWTRFSKQEGADGSVAVQIDPARGSFAGAPSRRSYEVRLVGVLPAARVTCNGSALMYEPREGSIGWRYDGDRTTLIVRTKELPVEEAVRLQIEPVPHAPGDASLTQGVPRLLSRLTKAMDILEGQWPKEWPPDALVRARQTGDRISLRPSTAVAELRYLHSGMPDVLAKIDSMKIDPSVIQQVEAHLRDTTGKDQR